MKNLFYSISSDTAADVCISYCAPSTLHSDQKMPCINDTGTTVSVASIMDVSSDIFVCCNGVTPLPYEWKKEKLYSCSLAVGVARRRLQAPRKKYPSCPKSFCIPQFNNYTRGVLRL